MNEKSKSKWYWRWLRRGLIGLAVLATLIAVLVTEEDVRGKHDWEAYKSAAEARGERFDLASLVSPAVPADQNFFMAPVVAQALQAESNRMGELGKGGAAKADPLHFNLYRGDSANWPSAGGNWQRGTFTDLKAWQHYFVVYNKSPAGKTNGFPAASKLQTPAEDVLLAMSRFSPTLDELRDASLRPHAQMPLDYDAGFEVVSTVMPWLADEKRCAQLLQLRAIAELNAGQSVQALDDIKLSLRLVDSLRSQPFLISHLVRIAAMSIAIQPIYEGLANGCWNDAQLTDLESALGQEDVLADFRFAMRGERTCAIETLETQRLTRQMKSYALRDGAEVMVTNSLVFVPAAYFYQNELAFARLYDRSVLPLVDVTNRTVSVSGYNSVEADSKEQMKHYSPYTIQALEIFPSVARCVVKFAVAQGEVDLARVACALERYRLAHGSYPENLEALAPQFINPLPHDLINGQPLHYRRTDDGKYVLYSIGWDQKDDGGRVVPNKEGRYNWEQGDWVWQYPAH